MDVKGFGARFQGFSGIMNYFLKMKLGEPSSYPVDHGTVPVHGGLPAAATKRLVGALAAWRCRAQLLAVGIEERRGRRCDAHRGYHEAAERRIWASNEEPKQRRVGARLRHE
jgi:hypothetical protein